MAMGQVLRARQLIFGTLPVNLLDRSSLSMAARLLWAVLDSCGSQNVRPSIEFLAIRCGLAPTNRSTIYRALDELVSAGFLEIASSRGASGTNNYFLKLPDYCLCDTPEVLEAALKAAPAANENGWAAARGRTAKRKAKGAAWDRTAWLLGRVQERAERARQVKLALGVPTAAAPAPATAAATATALGEPTATLAPPATALGELVAPAGWEGYSAAFEKLHGRPFAWTKTSAATAARICRQLAPELVPGTWGAFLQDDYWKAKRHPWAALAKTWQDYVPARVALPTCSHAQTTSSTERGHQGGRQGFWHVSTCTSCKKETARSFSAEMTEAEKETLRQAPFAQDWLRKHGTYPDGLN